MFVLWKKIVPKSPFVNKSALIQVMAWYLTGDKPLCEPILTKMFDAIWPYPAHNELIHWPLGNVGMVLN